MQTFHPVSLPGMLIAMVTVSLAAPPTKRPQNGPCVGMDCLHGILMHGDPDPGNDHAIQDTYNRLKLQDIVKGKVTESGPCQGKGCLDAVVRDTAVDNAAKTETRIAGPGKLPDPEGPCIGMDCLHGVLMHGDGSVGDSHRADDARMRIRNEKESSPPSIMDPELAMHGGGSKIHGYSTIPDLVPLTGDGHPPTDVDPERLLHSPGESHRHLPREEDPHSISGGRSVEGKKKSTGLDPEILLHGPEGSHHHFDDILGTEANDDIRKLSGVRDPHGLIHGDFDVGISESRRKEIRRVLREERELQLEKEKEDSGYTLRFISDGLLDEIQELQQRYLPKFWGLSGLIYDAAPEVDHTDVPDTRSGAVVQSRDVMVAAAEKEAPAIDAPTDIRRTKVKDVSAEKGREIGPSRRRDTGL